MAGTSRLSSQAYSSRKPSRLVPSPQGVSRLAGLPRPKGAGEGGVGCASCGDAVAARGFAEPLVELSRERGLSLFAAFGALHRAWVHARLGDREIGVTELRPALAA